MRVKLPSGDIIEGSVIFKGVENDFATQRDVSRTKRDIKTFAIKVAVPNPERRLFTGMTATVLLPHPPKRKAGSRGSDVMDPKPINAVEVDHLTKKFGDLVAVNDVSFNVARARDFWPARAEWRGQDHSDSHDDDAHAANFRDRANRGARHRHRCRWSAPRDGRDPTGVDLRPGTHRQRKIC